MEANALAEEAEVLELFQRAKENVETTVVWAESVLSRIEPLRAARHMTGHEVDPLFAALEASTAEAEAALAAYDADKAAVARRQGDVDLLTRLLTRPRTPIAIDRTSVLCTGVRS